MSGGDKSDFSVLAVPGDDKALLSFRILGTRIQIAVVRKDLKEIVSVIRRVERDLREEEEE